MNNLVLEPQVLKAKDLPSHFITENLIGYWQLLCAFKSVTRYGREWAEACCVTGTRDSKSKQKIAKMAEPPVCNIILRINIIRLGRLFTHATAEATSYAFILLLINNKF